MLSLDSWPRSLARRKLLDHASRRAVQPFRSVCAALRAAVAAMAVRALLLLLLPACSSLHVLPGLGRSQLSPTCSELCTFDASSQLATEPKHFIHSVINETGNLGLVSMPRKEATLYLTKARPTTLRAPPLAHSAPAGGYRELRAWRSGGDGCVAPFPLALSALTRARVRRLHWRLLRRNHARAAQYGPLQPPVLGV